MCRNKKGKYRIELINLSGEIVFLSFDSENHFREKLMNRNLPDEAYLLRFWNKEECFCEKLLVDHNCESGKSVRFVEENTAPMI